MAYYWKFWANLLIWMNLISRHLLSLSLPKLGIQTNWKGQIPIIWWLLYMWIVDSKFSFSMRNDSIYRLKTQLHAVDRHCYCTLRAHRTVRVKVLNHPGPVSVQVGDSEQIFIWKTKPRTDFKPSSFEKQPACLKRNLVVSRFWPALC